MSLELAASNSKKIKFLALAAKEVMEEEKQTVTLRMTGRDEEGSKRVEKVEVGTHNPDTLRYISRKLEGKGVLRMDRHPSDGRGLQNSPHKSGHGGKYTWEGPASDVMENELDAAPAAIDEGDPNYVDEAAEERVMKGEEPGMEGKVVGVVEVAKVAEACEGVCRIEVDPSLQTYL